MIVNLGVVHAYVSAIYTCGCLFLKAERNDLAEEAPPTPPSLQQQQQQQQQTPSPPAVSTEESNGERRRRWIRGVIAIRYAPHHSPLQLRLPLPLRALGGGEENSPPSPPHCRSIFYFREA